MKVTKIYTYPIKSFRPTSVDTAEVTKHGFPYDRRFMILQVGKGEDGNPEYKNMHVAGFPEMVLFFTALCPPSADGAGDGKITVTFKPPHGEPRSIDIPLQPNTDGLEVIEVVMHLSPTQAYRMPLEYNDWLSSCFGYDVILAYLGEHHRPVLMSSSSRQTQQQNASNGWLSSITTRASSYLPWGVSETERSEITFADCAPYLIVSDRSMDDIHNRLPDGEKMDITKFRPNIIVSGAHEPWDEDYWGEITIKDEAFGDTQMECAQNCGRCKSINIDYATGKPGTAQSGKMLAKMQRDRRIDPGTKYSPVFGRYSFLSPDSEGHTIKVGSEVVVSRKNPEKTRFDWKGLATT